jgi:hypothetical protein
MGLADGVARVARSNGRWSAERVLEAGTVSSLVVDPRRPGRAYVAAGESGLWRTSDAGASWEHVGTGIAHPVVCTVALSCSEHTADGSVVYVGTQMAALYRSEDGGATFRELDSFQAIPARSEWATPPAPDTHHVCSIVADPVGDEGVLLAGIELGGVVRSSDGGRTWDDAAHPIADLDPHHMVTHPGAPKRVYLAGGVSYCETADSGVNWERPVDGLEVCYFDQIAVDPGDPDTIVISAGRDPFSGHGAFGAVAPWSTLYRRTSGSDWVEITEGLPSREGTTMGILSTNDAEPGVFYYATNTAELYRSGDGGTTWEHQDVAWTGGAPVVLSMDGLAA